MDETKQIETFVSESAVENLNGLAWNSGFRVGMIFGAGLTFFLVASMGLFR